MVVPMKPEMDDTVADYMQYTVIVKPFRAEEVLAKLETMGVIDYFVREAKGYSRQKGYLERYIGSEYSQAFIPKVEITITVAKEKVEQLQAAIVEIARTGRIGDGKMFGIPIMGDVMEF